MLIFFMAGSLHATSLISIILRPSLSLLWGHFQILCSWFFTCNKCNQHYFETKVGAEVKVNGGHFRLFVAEIKYCSLRSLVVWVSDIRLSCCIRWLNLFMTQFLWKYFYAKVEAEVTWSQIWSPLFLIPEPNGP